MSYGAHYDTDPGVTPLVREFFGHLKTRNMKLKDLEAISGLNQTTIIELAAPQDAQHRQLRSGVEHHRAEAGDRTDGRDEARHPQGVGQSPALPDL